MSFVDDFLSRYPIRILETLLCDRTTGRNIIWADNEYEALGPGYMGDDEIAAEKITGESSDIIKPRIAKAAERQSMRTKSRAEVFTPSWLCNQMNNDLDEAWFGRRDVFNVESEHSWEPTGGPIEFPKKKGHGWHAYVEAPKLEITCGEAPFVCSRYDTVTGDELPVRSRVGFLDRKLRIVSEKTKTRKEWVRQALAALKASYGFECQGDNLLIARINVFETFVEHLRGRWGDVPTSEELDQAAWVVSWNFWQMNGLTDAVPTIKMGAEIESTLGTFAVPEPEPIQPSLFDMFDVVFPDETTEISIDEEPKETVPLCVIYDWQNGEPLEFASVKGRASAMGKKFYAVIGNPPYQGECDSNGRKPPIYHYFMDQAYEVGDKVELITPSRYLFDAGQTPKAWNRKMLNDPHLRVLLFEADGSKVFPGTQIKGGVAATLRDTTREFGAIGTFTVFDDLNSIIRKVRKEVENGNPSRGYLDSIVSPRGNYRTTDTFFADYPQAKNELGKGTGNMIASNFFELIPECASEQPVDDCYKFLCRINNHRTYRWIKKRYIQSNAFARTFNLAFSKSNGNGTFGEALTMPEVLAEGECATDTFISIGQGSTKLEADNMLKYIQTRFLRAMLGVKKVTQDNSRGVWKYVPLQDFTPNSDIDWSQSVANIDKQLYAKYELDDDEISFIESHVKEMR